MKQLKKTVKSITREQALELAARQIIEKSIGDWKVYKKFPRGFTIYNPPKNCWFIVLPCSLGEFPMVMGSGSRLICVCKRTGRVLYDGRGNSE